MKPCDDPSPWRQALDFFLGEYMPTHRGLSPRTQDTYATSLRMFVDHVRRHRHGPHEVEVCDVLAFLESLEKERDNRVSSRNLRLAALKSFFRALLLWDPSHCKEYEHLLRVPSKRCTRQAPDPLDPEELRQVFGGVDAASRQGFRDLTILRYLYNTGSRISEVAAARTSWLSLGDHPQVTIRGKGGKSRICPLWPTTAEMLRVYLRQERHEPRKGYEDFLFVTRLGTCFRRAGLWKLLHGYLARAATTTPSLRAKRLTPHSLRHTTASHLLRAGVEINVIKAWLGHADVSTTSQYLDLDMDKKREALDRFLSLDLDRLAPGSKGCPRPLPAPLVAWLERQ